MEAFSLNPADQISCEVLPLGETGDHHALIFDNVFAHPLHVRNAALDPGMSWKIADSSYPGMTAEPRADLSPLLRFLGTRLERTVLEEETRIVFSIITKEENDLKAHQQRPHFDGPCMAALVYLNLPEQCRGGTAFFRHRATGLVRFPDRMTATHLEIIKRLELSSPRQLQKLVSEPPAQPNEFIEASSDEWERIGRVEMKFNRLVLYDGQIFHSGIIPRGAFGTRLAERRLTLNLFLRDF